MSIFVTTEWLMHRVLFTRFGEIVAIRLFDRSTTHSAGSPWKSLSSFVKLLLDAFSLVSLGNTDCNIKSKHK